MPACCTVMRMADRVAGLIAYTVKLDFKTA